MLAELAASELGPDAAIPSERELMATYGVSRATVRKAIESLVADGLLHRIHGKGTFVARPAAARAGCTSRRSPRTCGDAG